MLDHSLIFSIFIIFLGAAVLSTFALITRQSMLVAYMLLGILLGPWGLKWVGDAALVQRIGNVGIIFLLFLLGLHLPPQKLFHMLKKISLVGLVSSVLFALIGYGVGVAFGYTQVESIIIGAAMMFSSTIIGIKLLPTTILHHQHTGEVMISVLLLQDLIAIAVLLIIHATTAGGSIIQDVSLVIFGFPAILLFAYVIERVILVRLLAKFSRIKEYMFLIAIAWCLSMAELASYLGLSNEIGAFIAGVSLAASPVSLYIAESLKPVRDFFLVMFFFSVGASFNLHDFPQVIGPAILLAGLLMVIKPVAYRFLLHFVGESKQVSWEVGARLGQVSEFSLIIAFVAESSHLLGTMAVNLIQAVTMLSFLISSYWVVMRYPTPVATSDRLRRD